MTVIEQHSISPGGPVKSQSRVIPTIASIEMWERFSFYGLQAILVYYLYEQLTLTEAQATAMMGAYGSMLYLCTLVGGWVSDRIMGAEKTLLAGALLVMAGHLLISTSSGFAMLMAGLMPIALGSGLVKTAAITILGLVYSTPGPQRSVAFQLFYLGINIGALGGPLVTGWLASTYSYHHGFAAAAVLMAIGLVAYLVMRRSLAGVPTTPPHPLSLTGKVVFLAGVGAVLGGLAWALGSGIIDPGTLAVVFLCLSVALAVGIFALVLRSGLTSAAEKHKVRAFLPLFVVSVMYWTLQSQLYGILAVYSEQRLDRTIGSFVVPAAWLQSLNPLYILLFAAPVAYLWGRWMKHDRAAMSTGIIIAGASMFVLLPYVEAAANSTPFIMLALCILLMSLGELLIGPVGMATTSAHAPKAYATRFSALYFLTLAIGTSLAGTLSPWFHASEMAYLLLVGGVPVAVGLMLLVRVR